MSPLRKRCFLVIVGILVTSGQVGAECKDPNLPTKNLREAVIGSCEVYQKRVNPTSFCEDNLKNCSAIWEAFYDATSYQPTCNVSADRYDAYVQLTNHSVPTDHSLFWENVYPFIQRFSNTGARLTTISDTLTGYIGDVLVWCSSPDTTDGMASPDTVCPGFETTPSCPMSATRAFWIAASRNFGSRAEGTIYVMLNASVDPIYDEDSYFAQYEQTSLRPGRVTKAVVLLVNERVDGTKSGCDDPSLQTLSTALHSKDIGYECEENRRDVITLLCHDQPGLPVCLSGYTSSSDKHVTATGTLLMTILLYVLLL